MLFRCDQCGCILSASVADFTGFTKSKAAVLTTAGGINALFKKASGKQVRTVYVKVESVGSAQTTKLYEGKEFELEELQKLAESL